MRIFGLLLLLMIQGICLLMSVEVPIPSNTTSGTSGYPFGLGYTQHRFQAIYTAGEIGTTGKIRSLTFNFSQIPGNVISNCTIRMKHTTSTTFASQSWDSSASFTTVFSGNVSINSTGEFTFIFTTPFNYVGGANNLLIDYSFRNAAGVPIYANQPYVFPAGGGNRGLYYRDTTSLTAFPTTWSGIGPPSPSYATWIPTAKIGISPTIYVKPGGAGKQDGTDWNNAYGDLNSALNNAASGDDIWVAAGTYKPSIFTRSNSFTVKSGVNVYGGFAGTETSVFQRSFANQTILSGDIGVSNVKTDNSYNVVTSLGSGTIDNFIIRDGYANSSYPSNGGGGILCSGSTATIRNCVLINNDASYAGGAIFIASGSPYIDNCVFITNGSNTCTWGGAIEDEGGGSPTIRHCTFYGNIASNGGAIEAVLSGTLTIINSVFWDNDSLGEEIYNNGKTIAMSGTSVKGGLTQVSSPGGSYINNGSNDSNNPLFINVGDFDGPDNKYGTRDDGLHPSSNSLVVHSGVNNSYSTDIAGRVRNQGGGPDRGAYEIQVVYVNSLANGSNNGSSWSDGYVQLSDALNATPNDAIEIWTRTGTYKPTTNTDRTQSFKARAGLGLYGGFGGVETSRSQSDWRVRPTLLSGDIGTINIPGDNSYNVISTLSDGGVIDGFFITDGVANGGSSKGGGIYATHNLTIAHCVLFNNSSQTSGGGMSLYGPGKTASITDTFFGGNTTSGWGGGLHVYGNANIQNCVFSQNVSSNGSYGGGGIFSDGGSNLTITNCTLSLNTSVATGGGIACYSSSPQIRNTILWDNKTGGVANQIGTYNVGANPTVINCLIQGGLPANTINGGGLVTSNPNFYDATTPTGPDNILGTGDDGLRIQFGSPAANAGSNVGITSTDIAGNNRAIGTPDIGAYETLTRIYVDKDAGGANNGTSWANAYRRLESALGVAASGINEIWIAEGTYFPSILPIRTASFQLVSNVSIFAGFNTGAETQLSQRNVSLNRTILSGDIDGDSTNANNSYHVVTGANKAILDGVNIEYGKAEGGVLSEGSGGGLYDFNTSSILINCIFANNQAEYFGGAILSYGTSVTQCRSTVFTYNEAGYGGAILSYQSSLYILNSTFTNNTATNIAGSVYFYNGPSNVYNTITYKDSLPSLYNDASTLGVGLSNIEGSGGSGGSWDTSIGVDHGGNIDADPNFVKDSDPRGSDNKLGTDDDGLRLLASSPCIDKGGSVGGPFKDILNVDRPSGGAPDMGAYEGKIVTVDFQASVSANAEAITAPSINVRLSQASDIPVTVIYQRAAGGSGGDATLGSDFSLGSTTLVFSPGETVKPLTLTIVNDNIQEANETIGFNFASVANARLDGTMLHTYTITNDDFANIITSPTFLSIDESGGGSSKNFTLSLATTPADGKSVSVNVTSSVPGEALLSHGAQINQTMVTVTWTSGNYGPKTVSVNAVNDAIDDGNVNLTAITEASTSTDTFYNGKNAADVAVTVVDDDEVGLVVAINGGKAQVEVTEANVAATDSFTLRLNSQPTGPVTVQVVSSNSSDAIVSPSTLTFTTSGPQAWNLTQAVTVTAVNDQVDEPGSNPILFSVNLAADSGDLKYDPLSAAVPGHLTDNDTAGISITPSATQNPSENGGTVVYDVVLTTKPTAPVTIGSGMNLIISSDTNEGTIDKSTLTFGTNNGPGGWDTVQKITVTAVNDNIDEANPNYDIIFPAAISTDPKYSGNFATTRTINNTDDDTAAFVFTPNAGLITSENGGTAETIVRLASQPTANVTLTISSDDTSEGLVQLGMGTPAASVNVVLTSSNWDMGVPITIVGQNDSFGITDPDSAPAGDPITYHLKITAISTGDATYGALTINTNVVEINNEDDVTEGVAISPTTVNVAENGGTTTFAVSLNTPPAGGETVTVSFSSTATHALIDDFGNGGDLPSTSLSFQFNSGNYNVPRIVQVTGVNDNIDNSGDKRTTTIVIDCTSTDGASGYFSVNPTDVTVNVLDDDTRGVSVAPTNGLTTTESGGQAIFTVVLTSQPSTNDTITVTLQSNDITEGKIREGFFGAGGTSVPLTFNQSNWNNAKVISVIGQDDDLADGPVVYTVTTQSVAAAGGDYSSGISLPGAVNVTNIDNDNAGILLSTTTMSLNEGSPGNSSTYTIRLTSRPTADVVINLDAGTKATVDSDTSSGGNQTQITFTATGNASPTPYSGGMQANWDVPITITVTAYDDQIADGTHAANVTHGVGSSDLAYNGMTVSDVVATITDNDTANVTSNPTNPSRLATSEDQSVTADTLSYVLATQPRGNVIILLSSDKPEEAVPVPDRLTLTPSNYNNAALHTVSIQGVDDDIADGQQAFKISASVVSADGAYDSFTVTDVDGDNDDDDSVGVTYTVSSPGSRLVTTESGGSTIISVRLTSEPTDNVTVTLTSNNTAEGSLSTNPLQLTFTPSNWDTEQFATVTGQRDYIDEAAASTDYTITIQASGSGSGYENNESYNGDVAAASGTIYLTNTDVDQAGVTISPLSGLLTSEDGTTAQYSIVLTSQPSDTVRINLNPGTQLSVPTSIDFTTGDWNIPQNITVSAIDDDIAEGQAGVPHAATVQHTLSFPATTDAQYNALGSLNTVNVLVTDNDTPGFTITKSVTPLVTHENPADLNATSTFQVNFTSEPTSTIRVVVTSADPTEVVLALDGMRASATTSVNFDIAPADWDQNTVPTITAFGINDDIDDGNKIINVTIAVDDANTVDTRYQDLGDSIITVTNVDKDTAGVTLVESPHDANFPLIPSDLSENIPSTAYTYTVVLTSEPTSDVTITITDDGQVDIDADLGTGGLQNTIIFTTTKDQAVSGNTAGWNVPVTVTVVPVDDVDAESAIHNSTITHGANGGGYTGVSVSNVTVSIADNDASTPPVISLPGPNPFVYDETGHQARIIDGTATVADVDSPNFHTGNITMSITANGVVSEDVLSVANQGTAAGEIGVSGSAITYNPVANTGAVQIATLSGGTAGAPLVIALSGASPSDVSVEAVQALMRHITYRNSSLNPNLTTREITVTVNDGDGGTSNAVTKNISITPFDDPPTMPDQSITTAMNRTLTGQLSASDPEGLSLTFTKLSDPTNGTLTVNSNGTYTYVPLNNDYQNDYTFTVRVEDPGMNQSSIATVTIRITGGDEARPLVIRAPPFETELGALFTFIGIDPGSKAGASPLQYLVQDVPVGITASVIPLTATATEVRAQVNWQVTGSPAVGDHYTFGILVIDVDGNSATYVPITLQVISPLGPG